MSIECIILDFDGTFTEVDAEARPFLEVFRRGLGDLVGEDFAARWDTTKERVLASPDKHGWENEGRIVAPAHADPYVLATTIAQILVAESGRIEAGDRHAAVERLFLASYPHAATVFRPDARMVVEALVRGGLPIFVVTNSKTEHVQAKLAKLAPAGLEHLIVRGDARKFAVTAPETSLDTPWTERWAAIPETRMVSGLGRPVHLRRGAYFDAIRRISEETGAEPEAMLVCGDIWELDLVLPALLGARIHLVTRPGTPEHEKRAVRATPGGSASPNLAGLLAELDITG
jgi:FMN phosphatase YigB (HAD superfamily)